MPTYEYECSKCSKRFEVFQSIKDEPLKKCPKCGSHVDRLLGSGSGIIFKGSGFYQTDYKNKKDSPSCGSSDQCKGCPSKKKGA